MYFFLVFLREFYLLFEALCQPLTTTYDHIHEKIRDPVRSPLVKLMRAKSVVGSVTTSESLVLYVFLLFFCGCWWWRYGGGVAAPRSLASGRPQTQRSPGSQGAETVYPGMHASSWTSKDQRNNLV